MKCSYLEVVVPEAGDIKSVERIRKTDDLGEGLEVAGTLDALVADLGVGRTLVKARGKASCDGTDHQEAYRTRSTLASWP